DCELVPRDIGGGFCATASTSTIDNVSGKCMWGSLLLVCDLRQTPIDSGSTIVSTSADIDFEYSERPFGKHFAHKRHRDVEHRHALGRASFGAAVMRVAVKNSRHRIASQRFFKTAASE